MKVLGTLVLIMLYHLTYSQLTTVVTKDKDDYYEEYSVLQTDKKVKHGSYIKLKKGFLGGYSLMTVGNYANGQKDGYWENYYAKSNNIKEKGFYKNDLRDSIWVLYYPERDENDLIEVKTSEGISIQVVDANPVACKAGKYKNDTIAGIWQYYDETGELTHSYDHDSGAVTFVRSRNNQNSENYNAGFIEGDYLFWQYLYETFDFEGLMNSINTKIHLEPGKLTFKFTINENGLIDDLHCTEQTINNKKMYARATETIQSLNGHLYPKKLNGTNQSEVKTISFALDTESNTSWSNSGRVRSSETSMDFYLKISMDN